MKLNEYKEEVFYKDEEEYEEDNEVYCAYCGCRYDEWRYRGCFVQVRNPLTNKYEDNCPCCYGLIFKNIHGENPEKA